MNTEANSSGDGKTVLPDFDLDPPASISSNTPTAATTSQAIPSQQTPVTTEPNKNFSSTEESAAIHFEDLQLI